jgi:uncharacterized protein (TIGR02588 family)
MGHICDRQHHLACRGWVVLYDWLGTPDTPPQLNVTQGDIRTAGEQFYVPFTVENTGGIRRKTFRSSVS